MTENCVCWICRNNHDDAYCEKGNSKFGSEDVRHTDECEDFGDADLVEDCDEEYVIRENNEAWDAWGMERDEDDNGENFGWS